MNPEQDPKMQAAILEVWNWTRFRVADALPTAVPDKGTDAAAKAAEIWVSAPDPGLRLRLVRG